ncbi:ABC transporter permease subunit [Limnovirga soli]|uniref:ABC transporter permease subunit n=1 Tax=Limnovirga soli TaxID=2656915 RepID=A0A8J8FEL0_9BACT|nr:ABC transporter permease subunit [Limnovirga soli]NNV56290.1 ABC transporter permease subunit [Limnovirga soli]
MKKIIKYVILDILRNKIVMSYTVFLLIISFSIFNLEDTAGKGLLSLLNIVLIIVPLVSIIFSTIYIYNSAEFIELMVSQPIKRKTLWLSIFVGLAGSMSLAFFIGAGIPILLFEFSATGITMIATGILLSIIFVAIALLASVCTRDKAKGIGVAILLWFYFSVLFDGLVLFILFQFSDYPIEKFMISVSALNPIDLARVLIILKMDVSVMLGYTGAVFQDFFGSQWGVIIAGIVLSAWAAVPLLLSLGKFNRKDL